MFKYKLASSDEDLNNSSEDVSFTIVTHNPNSSESKSHDQTDAVLEHLNEQFEIEKSKCWPFSRTLRVDIKPLCLLVNKTNYKINLIEKANDSLSELYHDLESLNGQICLSNTLNKNYKLQIESDEYTIRNYDLVKSTSHYESNWFRISDETSSPFYREQSQASNPILYANKCWIDLKLYPLNGSNSNKLKLIYLLLQNDSNHICRLIRIQNKFLLNNKTKFNFKFDLTTDYLAHLRTNKPVYISSTSEVSLAPNEFFSTGDLLNSDQADTVDEYYLNLTEVDSSRVSQSKLVILTTKEKAIKQISTSTSSNEHLLISRQCFCLYDLKHDASTRAFICAQKLLIGHNDGRLLVTLREDSNYLVELTNCLAHDLLVWPRISSNFIFENYMKNLSQLTNRSMFFMQRIPAKRTLRFNYDFIGTDHFPIENINEQIFFMFALANHEEQQVFQLSPTMCRIYETNFDIKFEQTDSVYFKYVASNDSKALKRLIKPAEYCLPNEVCSLDNDEANLSLNLNLNIDRLTVALNNDFSSQIYQTEILRLTSDYLNVKFCMSDSFSLEILSQHLQLDNQMFDLTNTDNNQLKLAAQKYDFPVVFIPRGNSAKAKTLNRPQAIYKTFDANSHLVEKEDHSNEQFIHLKLKFENHNKLKLILTEFDLNLKPFDIYLEDYLVYNLMKISMDYVGLITTKTNTNSNELSPSHEQDLNSSRDLSILFDPILMIKKLNISKIDALVSLQTSLKIYCATYKTPVIFDELSVIGLPWSVQSSPQMVKLFTSHYLTSLLFRLGWVVGSLDLIGSPTAFIHTVSSGVYDFLRLPYRGLRDSGPTGFIQGFSHGTLSLIKNLSAGTITSITSFSSFVSRNMDILSFDPDHLARQEQLRHQLINDQFSGNSLVQISSGFIISIMGALGGLGYY